MLNRGMNLAPLSGLTIRLLAPSQSPLNVVTEAVGTAAIIATGRIDSSELALHR